mmetsp:Transcript_38972/g.125204  ORF Transcript_38972/g.125204 Transcript_38972/m.125204 type:complete len:328 (-) Transcript_38972:4630-5613(-)
MSMSCKTPTSGLFSVVSLSPCTDAAAAAAAGAAAAEPAAEPAADDPCAAATPPRAVATTVAAPTAAPTFVAAIGLPLPSKPSPTTPGTSLRAECLHFMSRNLCRPSRSPLLSCAPQVVKTVTTFVELFQCAHIKGVIAEEDLLALFNSWMAPAPNNRSASSASSAKATSSSNVGPPASARAAGSGSGARQAGQVAPFTPSARQRPKQSRRWKACLQPCSRTSGSSSEPSHMHTMHADSASVCSPAASLLLSSASTADKAKPFNCWLDNSRGALANASNAASARGCKAVRIISGANKAGISCDQFARFMRTGHFSSNGLIKISRVPPR